MRNQEEKVALNFVMSLVKWKELGRLSNRFLELQTE